ncbi:MAG: DHH family phosphoesterase [Nanoarchaeota archaeon]
MAFSIQSEILEALRPEFEKAADYIDQCIRRGRPIIIRHHNDCDGWAGAIALERAIYSRIRQEKGKYAFRYYTRAASPSPYYSMSDSVRDMTQGVSSRFTDEKPLIIIVDNGSTEQDVMAIRHGKVFGADFIVIDHHFFGDDRITPLVKAHINPHRIAEDHPFTAGMLCMEMALMLHAPEVLVKPLAALSGAGDRVENRQYQVMAQECGYEPEQLRKLAKTIDYLITKLHFGDTQEYVDILFGGDRGQQEKLIAAIFPEVERMEEKSLAIADANAHRENHGDTCLQILRYEEVFSRHSSYPKKGKVVGMLHDKAGDGKVVTAGVSDGSITLRATDEQDFSLHEFLAKVRAELPASFAEGGGHARAGTIRVCPSTTEEVLDMLREYIS